MPISNTFMNALDALLLWSGWLEASFTIQKNVRVIQLYLSRNTSGQPVLDTLDTSPFFHPKQSRNFRWAAQIVDQLCVGHGHD